MAERKTRRGPSCCLKSCYRFNPVDKDNMKHAHQRIQWINPTYIAIGHSSNKRVRILVNIQLSVICKRSRYVVYGNLHV